MDLSKSDRNSQLVVLFKEGRTLQELGDMYGYTREYIRQLLKQCGITGKDGGLRVRMTKQKCIVEGCDKPYKSKGMCYNHYMSFTAYGRRGTPLTLEQYLELKRKQAETKNGSL